MSTNIGLSNIIESFKSVFYRGPVKAVIENFGLDTYFYRIYVFIYLNIADSLTIRVNTTTATFRMSTQKEYGRVNGIMDEKNVIEDLLSKLQPDDIVYDIGANIGLYTCLIENSLTDGRVFAFEPHPATVARLEENIALNGLDAVVYQYALSNTCGEAELLPDDGELGSGEHTLVNNTTINTMTVRTTPGDNLIEEEKLPKPNVLKIDVEGQELDVIRGLKQALSDSECRLVYCEIHPEKLNSYGATEESLHNELEKAEFEIERINERGSTYFVRASSY